MTPTIVRDFMDGDPVLWSLIFGIAVCVVGEYIIWWRLV